MDNATEKICPKCQTVNPIAANFCRHCRHEFSDASKKGTNLSPIIRDFSIQESAYTIGSIIHVEWITENASHIALNGTDVTHLMKWEMKVERPTVLILSAENEYNSVTQQLKIRPTPLPSIRYFRTSANKIMDGREVKLEWKVDGASRVELISSDGVTDVSDNDAIRITPSKTDTYILQCYSIGDETIFIEEEIDIQVIHKVRIEKFETDKEMLVESEKATLKWNVQNASSIEIWPMHTDVTRLRKLQVSPTHTTEYRLIARNELSQEEASLTIVVRQLPKLEMQALNGLADLQLPSCHIETQSYTFDSVTMPTKWAKLNIKKILSNITKMKDKMKTRFLSFPLSINKFLK